MSNMKTLLENFKRYSMPDYGEGNLTMDDVHAVLKKLDAQGISYVGTPQDVWDEFKHLNNADDLEDQMMLAHAMFERLNEAWEGESAATRRMAKRFTGGSIDIEPLSDEEQTAGAEAYYELFEFLADSNLPGDKPSDKLQYALRWIAKFEQHHIDRGAHQTRLDTDPQYRFAHGVKEGKK